MSKTRFLREGKKIPEGVKGGKVVVSSKEVYIKGESLKNVAQYLRVKVVKGKVDKSGQKVINSLYTVSIDYYLSKCYIKSMKRVSKFVGRKQRIDFTLTRCISSLLFVYKYE